MVGPRDVLEVRHSVLLPGLWKRQGGLGESIQKVGRGTPASVTVVLSLAVLPPAMHSPAEDPGKPHSAGLPSHARTHPLGHGSGHNPAPPPAPGQVPSPLLPSVITSLLL